MSFYKFFNNRLEKITIDGLTGKYNIRLGGEKEDSLFGSGVSVNLFDNKITSSTKNQKRYISTSPVASVLVKKKFFSSLKNNNDLQWMDQTEKFFLRATKALFAYKVNQVRAYESLTKFEDYLSKYNEINLNLFVDAYNQAQLLNVDNTENLNLLSSFGQAISNSFKSISYDDYIDDVLKILQRNAFSKDIRLTTWIVDPTSIDNYGTGPGTGVIEFTNISNFTTTTSIQTSPSPASLSYPDPYRISNIYDDDIEVAIGEALTGNFRIFQNIVNGEIGIEAVDPKSILLSGIELLGAGDFEKTLDIELVRKRMRKFFLGKTLINPGDTVHFYIKSNTHLHQIDNFLDESYYEIDEVILEAERNLFTNKSIDLQTYKKIRKYSDDSFSMRHVYAGLVESTSHSFSGGSWTVKVAISDNMRWLQWSRFMYQPGLSDPQGLLEDPLTPFVQKTDETGRALITGGIELLPENKELLRRGLLRYDSGILNGQFAKESNLLQGQFNGNGSLRNTKILQHPSGFVYRWKDGIITATAATSVVDPINEDLMTQQQLRQNYALLVTENTLINLDVANILSVLIVGQPYNVETFLEQAYAAHNINLGSSITTLDQQSPLLSVLETVRRQNVFFGNFRPYRMITLSNQTVNESFSNNLIRSEVNKKLEKLRSRKIELERKLFDLRSISGDSSNQNRNVSLVEATLIEEINLIDETINEQIKLAQRKGSVGDALTENFNLFGRNRVLPLTGNIDADANVTRAMMLVGAQRRIEDTRLNRDQNLFIVSDQYDESTDVRDISKFLQGLQNTKYKVFESLYTSIYERCEAAAKVPNFEFFTNTQGHLEFRPPQWNRTPITVLQELFNLKNERGINIIPPFLEDMFETRSSSLKIKIHFLNIKIAILALLLNKYPDRTIIPGMYRKGKDSLRFFGIKLTEDGIQQRNSVQSNLTTFNNIVRNQSDPRLSLNISLSEDGNILNGDVSTVLGRFDQIFQEQQNVLEGVLNSNVSGGSEDARKDGIASVESINILRESFLSLYGLDPAGDIIKRNGPFTEADFVENNLQNPRDSRVITKINNYLNKLQSVISERDQYVVALNRVQEKQRELRDIESILEGEFTNEEKVTSIDNLYNTVKTISDIFTGSVTEGSIFDHLIEDNTRNLLGPGSGRRFIIDDVQIRNADFSENPPDYVSVNVFGNNAFVGNAQQQAFDNKYYWAGATDFDLWRQYGFKTRNDINLPYANDSENQCRPFAQLELQVQRTKINKGSLSLVGNEYYEPGDNIFIPSKGLMYYVDTVSHSFDYNGTFSTTLNLINGHPPGEYLPSPLDIIGQQLLINDPSASLITYRNLRGDDVYRPLQPDCAIVFPPGRLINQDEITILLDYRDNMVRFANMMVNLNSILLGNRYLLIRGFYRNNEDRERVENNIDIIESLFINPQMISQRENVFQNVDGFSNLADDLIDAAGVSTRRFGTSIGNTKVLKKLELPNRLPLLQINKEKIIKQLVSLGPDSQSEIKCINNLLAEKIGVQDAGILPLGGPKQKSFLDIRDDLNKINSIIEIGILDINKETNINSDGE
jgi:hypothetical protein